MKNSCFVIMGFGTKKIPNTNVTVNLDDTYKYLIKPVLIELGLVSIYDDSMHKNFYRCDEFITTQAIDKTFLTNLYIANIVVADITALNQNAIYELGLRHAMKPKHTIIMCDDKTFHNNKFFDLNFQPQIIYDSEKQKDEDEIQRISNILTKTIEICKESDDEYVDSPVFLHGIYKNAVNSISKFSHSTKSSLKNEIARGNDLLENEEYSEAEIVFKNIIENINYCENDIVCSYVLATYKKDLYVDNLKYSFELLQKYINLEDTTYEDALGIAGAINLKIFNISKEPHHLFLALEYYRKGSNHESGNIYCGKNYCSTLLKIYMVESSIEIIREYYYTAVHDAKIFLTHANLISRKSDKHNNAWFLSNQNDLMLIANLVRDVPFRVAHNTKRQKNTVERGRVELLKDLKNVREIIGISCQ